MHAGAADTPIEAAERFWADVEEILTSPEYKHSHPAARQGVAKYKAARTSQAPHGPLPEAVYNQGEEQTARVIDGIIRHGLPGPR